MSKNIDYSTKVHLGGKKNEVTSHQSHLVLNIIHEMNPTGNKENQRIRTDILICHSKIPLFILHSQKFCLPGMLYQLLTLSFQEL